MIVHATVRAPETNCVDSAAAPGGYSLLLKQLLDTGLACAPTQEIVYRDLVRYDYTKLRERVGRLASGLAARGLRHGATVGVLDWDSHRYLECYFAIPSMGAVLHMVNIRLSPEQILYTINHAADELLLVHMDFLPMLESIWDRIEGVRHVVVLTDDGKVPDSRVPIAAEYEAMLAAASPDFLFPDFDENMRATTFYTTGTTGLPKGVFFSHRQLVLHSLATAAALGVNPAQGRLHRADVYMPITPMFHVHAWGLPFVATMLGLKQVYPGRYSPEMLLALYERERVTFSHCVPTLLDMLLSCPAAAGMDFSGWTIVIGGSAMPTGLARAALDRGIDVFSGYGMSETCPILTLAQLSNETLEQDRDAQIEQRTRAGVPIPLVDIQIVDSEMTPQPRDGRSAGEIVARAPWLTQGYFKDDRNSQILWEGGYLHTNDVGVFHPDGTLQVTDRIKDVIKSGGEWVSSIEIEDLISQHKSVSEVAVIGIADTRWGERPLAIVVAKTDCADDLCEYSIQTFLEAFCERGTISKWAVPARIIFADAIEMTSVGKIDKKALRIRYG